jgi:archaellum biogenesis protein FlaJ (TadC family)
LKHTVKDSLLYTSIISLQNNFSLYLSQRVVFKILIQSTTKKRNEIENETTTELTKPVNLAKRHISRHEKLKWISQEERLAKSYKNKNGLEGVYRLKTPPFPGTQLSEPYCYPHANFPIE